MEFGLIDVQKRTVNQCLIITKQTLFDLKNKHNQNQKGNMVAFDQCVCKNDGIFAQHKDRTVLCFQINISPLLTKSLEIQVAKLFKNRCPMRIDFNPLCPHGPVDLWQTEAN